APDQPAPPATAGWAPPPPPVAPPVAVPPVVLESPVLPARAAGPVVHLNAADGREMELQFNTRDGWDTACVAPCNLPVNRAALYRVNGPGMRPSQPFNVP